MRPWDIPIYLSEYHLALLFHFSLDLEESIDREAVTKLTL